MRNPYEQTHYTLCPLHEDNVEVPDYYGCACEEIERDYAAYMQEQQWELAREEGWL